MLAQPQCGKVCLDICKVKGKGYNWEEQEYYVSTMTLLLEEIMHQMARVNGYAETGLSL